jgi:hypothetical protein
MLGWKPSIMQRLQVISDLEVRYTLAVAYEIQHEISKRKPFLHSRAILRQIKTQLRLAQEEENIHNSNPRYEKISLIAEYIFSNDVFEQSRKIVERYYNVHPRRKQEEAPEVTPNIADTIEAIERYENKNTDKVAEMYRNLIFGKEKEEASNDDK